jgi:hypothetical protein
MEIMMIIPAKMFIGVATRPAFVACFAQTTAGVELCDSTAV